MAFTDDLKDFFTAFVDLMGAYRSLAVLKVIKFLGRWL